MLKEESGFVGGAVCGLVSPDAEGLEDWVAAFVGGLVFVGGGEGGVVTFGGFQEEEGVLGGHGEDLGDGAAVDEE
jgi:hypothetical protein